jgi:hypothetical protein
LAEKKVGEMGVRMVDATVLMRAEQKVDERAGEMDAEWVSERVA